MLHKSLGIPDQQVLSLIPLFHPSPGTRLPLDSAGILPRDGSKRSSHLYLSLRSVAVVGLATEIAGRSWWIRIQATRRFAWPGRGQLSSSQKQPLKEVDAVRDVDRSII